jgi:hypothetical protein
MPNPRALWWKSTKLSPSFFQSLTPNCFEVSNIWIQYSAQLQPTLREREVIMAEQPVCVNQLTYISNNALSLTWFWQDNGKKLLDFLWWKQNKSRLEILARELIIIRILLLIPKTSSSRIFKWEIAVLYILPKQVIPSLRRYLGNTRNRFPRVENIVYLNVKLGKVYQTKEYGRLFLL